MARRAGNLRFGVLLLAMGIAALLWGMAHGQRDIDRPFDLPVELTGLPEDLVVTDLSADAINVRIQGSRAALRNLNSGQLYYPLDVSGAKTGQGEYEVDLTLLDSELPKSARIVSRSPSHLLVRFERRGRKAVGVRADVEGEPAEGFIIENVEVIPRRVWLAGARSQVLRLTEVVTEPVNISGVSETVEREARLLLGGGTVWMEDKKPVTVRIAVAPDPALQPEEGGAGGAGTGDATGNGAADEAQGQG